MRTSATASGPRRQICLYIPQERQVEDNIPTLGKQIQVGQHRQRRERQSRVRTLPGRRLQRRTFEQLLVTYTLPLEK